MISFINETFKFHGRRPKRIKSFTKDELYRAYRSILSDRESAGCYDPVAYGIRELWARMGLKLSVLWKIDRNFKNLRRKKEN